LTGAINAWLANGERTGLAAQLIEIMNQEWQFTTCLIFRKGIFLKFWAEVLCLRFDRDIKEIRRFLRWTLLLTDFVALSQQQIAGQ
jgi:hypothetical protein